MSIFDNLTSLRNINLNTIDVREVQRIRSLFHSSFDKETAELRLMLNTTDKELVGIMTEALWFVRQKSESEKASQEFFAGLVRVLGQRIQKTPEDHSIFDSEMMQTLPRWNPVLRVVVLTRLNELKSTKVLFRKGKYDLSGVRQTLYGKKVMESPGLRTRYVLSKKEYIDFQMKTQAMGFELPQEIMPTEAEKYFRILDNIEEE